MQYIKQNIYAYDQYFIKDFMKKVQIQLCSIPTFQVPIDIVIIIYN